MSKFVLTVQNSVYDTEVHTQHLIEEEGPQMVKYHYHRTQRDFGYSPVMEGHKHMLQGPDAIVTDIYDIREVNDEEYEVLKKHMRRWPKI